MKAHDDVGHLDSRVVDVVLHFDGAARSPEHPDKGVPKHRVAKMPYVSGFVRVDVGMLDDDLAFRFAGFLGARTEQHSGTVKRPIEPNVDIAIACDFKRRYSFESAEPGGEPACDGFGRLPQLARELEGDRQRGFAELGRSEEHTSELQ